MLSLYINSRPVLKSRDRNSESLFILLNETNCIVTENVEDFRYEKDIVCLKYVFVLCRKIISQKHKKGKQNHYIIAKTWRKLHDFKECLQMGSQL